MLTLTQVLTKMERDDNFAVNLLLALYGRQTTDEQTDQMTAYENGMGFNGCDAGILSSFAEQALNNRRVRKAGGLAYDTDLSDKQIALLRKKLVKYGRQLVDLTNAAAEQKAAANSTFQLELPADTHVTLNVDNNPYGKMPPVQYHPLPEHLRKSARREAETQPLSLDPNSALVPCAGGFRFKTAKEYWEDGGREKFNDGVTEWFSERNEKGEMVTVGGGPVADDHDPFDDF